MGCTQILNYFPYFQGELSAGLRAYWIAFTSCRVFKPSLSPARAGTDWERVALYSE